MSVASIVRADFLAYSVDAEGTRRPLPQNITHIEPKYLVNLEWGQFGGTKSRIGVLPVENSSSSSTVNVTGSGGTMTYTGGGGGVPVQGIEAILMDAMHRTGRFRLVERKVLDKTLQEQDLGATGRIARSSAAKIGKVLGAQYLFQAVVTNYEAGVENKGGGLGGLIGGSAGALLGGLSIKSSKAVLGMNFRLINSETSEVVYTDQVQVAVEESGLSYGGAGYSSGSGGLGGFLSDYSKTPIGQAVISAVNQGVFGLVKQTGTSKVEGVVIKSTQGKIFLSLGEGAVAANEMLDLVKVGEQLIHPVTGVSLGGEEELVGSLKVVSVKEKYSIAKPVGIKASKVKRGDKVVSRRAAEPLMYAPTWEAPEEKGFFGGSKSNTGGGDNSGNPFSNF
ncbi:MAG: CsgG/HfaB family protein [Candidatus Sedimenticola sp. (ex Thyasira tokunagai)]